MCITLGKGEKACTLAACGPLSESVFNYGHYALQRQFKCPCASHVQFSTQVNWNGGKASDVKDNLMFACNSRTTISEILKNFHKQLGTVALANKQTVPRTIFNSRLIHIWWASISTRRCFWKRHKTHCCVHHNEGCHPVQRCDSLIHCLFRCFNGVCWK